jgi:hypothetical protein
MEERCILVTPDDVAYGEESKKTCSSSPSLPSPHAPAFLRSLPRLKRWHEHILIPLLSHPLA